MEFSPRNLLTHAGNRKWSRPAMGVRNGTAVPAVHTFRFLPLRSLEQLRLGVLEHLGIAQAPAWLFAAELREGTVLRLLTAYERSVPIAAVRPKLGKARNYRAIP